MWLPRQYRMAEAGEGGGSSSGSAGASDAGGGSAAGASDGQGTTPAASSWYPTEYAQDGSVTRYTSLPDYIESHKKLEKQFHTTRAIPDAEASPEDWQEFYKRLPGYPEQADGYQVEMPGLPEGMPDILPEQAVQSFLAMAHQHGLTTPQVQQIMQWFVESETANWQAMHEADEHARIAGYEALKQMWGTMADYNLAVGMEGLRRAYPGEGELDWLDTVVSRDADGKPQLLGNLPQFNRIAYEWAQSQGHGRFVAGAPGGPASVDAAQAELLQARVQRREGKISSEEFTRIQERLAPIIYGQDNGIFGGTITEADVTGA